MRYAGPLTPKQAAAFWTLSALNGDDLRRLAFQWLEEGLESDGVNILVGETDVTLRDHGRLFERCLTELGVSIESKRHAAWMLAQTLLRSVEAGGDPLDATYDILAMLHYPGFVLFAPRNCAPDGKAYAGEELGIEHMLGLYYTLDEYGLFKAESRRFMEELRVECLRVLAEFYTTPPTDLLDA